MPKQQPNSKSENIFSQLTLQADRPLSWGGFIPLVLVHTGDIDGLPVKVILEPHASPTFVRHDPIDRDQGGVVEISHCEQVGGSVAQGKTEAFRVWGKIFLC